METLYRDVFSSAHINDRPFDVNSVCSVVPFDLSPEDLGLKHVVRGARLLHSPASKAQLNLKQWDTRERVK